MKLRNTRSAAGAAALLALVATSVQAANDDDKLQTSFSGFGTIAATTTDSSKSEYITSSTQFKGASNSLDIGLNSMLGLQGVVRFGERFSVTGQALAKRVEGKDFDIGAEWLYGQYRVADGVDMRLGRVVLPVFSLSDSRNVTYAQPWLRQPNEVYGGHPFSTLDGIQGLWTHSVGAVVLSAQASYGKTDANVQIPGLGVTAIPARNVSNFSASAEMGAWSVRVASTRVTSPLSLPLTPTTTLHYDVRDKFTQLGAQYDDGHAIVMGEWAKRTQNNVPGMSGPAVASNSWYAAAGWRFGSWTPLIRYARYKNTSSINPGADTSSIGVSLRYELARNVAAKLQWDRYDAAAVNAFKTPAATKGTKVNVLGVGVDFVF
jgi:hypothetical protein